MTYNTLEKDYYKALQKITNSLKIKEQASKEELLYLLENNTLPRLKQNSLWIISAISGSGKTTILKQLASVGFCKLPNVTTRAQRAEETENDYVFVDKKTFLAWKLNNLLFHPHKRNGVLHAILKTDIQKLKNKDSFFYLDKSVAASLKLKEALPNNIKFTFLYVLTPTFKELYARITKRENLRKINGEKYLSKKEIFNRFKEEINDMKKSPKLPYIYIVNDSLNRVRKLLNKII